MSANSNDNDNTKSITFTIKDTKSYVPVVTLSVKDNQELPKLFSKEFERSVYWNEYKTKRENKNTTNEYRCFLESNFIAFNRFLFSFIQIKITMLKRLKLEGIIYQKALLRIITSSSMERTFITNPLILV